ncbi:N(4)-(Beta-N-acetylglucosaminyl)-L-asparaginase-like [Neocloeon triangulifer]|uniref:N(4)-(Beta-N-acetylglucosaminyl)-L-asparaginase- like n=1 Tax=Neocloeon triangulifer TaxID=2078957 RepID=UPI00286F34C2|nr:N(4)-(Beta-N-acetylglucosaminyl)-L-asparaginase-like [Neocloeon triangulifer]
MLGSARVVVVLLVGVAAANALVELKMLPDSGKVPLVVNTWPFLNATIQAWKSVFHQKKNAVDSVVRGCSTCEEEQCDGTVGYGGSPDENGETTLDAMIMDGVTMNVGAVGALRKVKNAIGVAKHVLHNTKHTLLVGEQATDFADKMGFPVENLTTDNSVIIYNIWKRHLCQPNNWLNVSPDPKTSCGPYAPSEFKKVTNAHSNSASEESHDTIGMLVIDSKGDVAAGTSTNGLRHKIPGRVGDSPIPGSGSYADNKVGAACATGDGDVLMRFLPSFLAVEEMRRGLTPTAAAEMAIGRVIEHYPDTMGAVIAANIDGDFGAACSGMKNFTFCVANAKYGGPTLITISCLKQQGKNKLEN